MLQPLHGLKGVEIIRPREYAGDVELLVGLPARRDFSTRLCDGFEIAVLVGNQCPATVQGRTTEFPAKLPFLKSPGTVWSSHGGYTGFFSLELSRQLYARLSAEWPGRAPADEGVAVVPSLLDLFWTAHRVLRTHEDATARTQALVDLLAAVFASHRGGRLAVDVAGVTRARDAIVAHPERDLSIEALAALAGMPVFELVEGFRARYGVGPAGYRRVVRLSRARRMLVAGATGDETARALGFASTRAFSRLFTRSVGIAPEQYA